MEEPPDPGSTELSSAIFFRPFQAWSSNHIPMSSFFLTCICMHACVYMFMGMCVCVCARTGAWWPVDNLRCCSQDSHPLSVKQNLSWPWSYLVRLGRLASQLQESFNPPASVLRFPAPNTQHFTWILDIKSGPPDCQASHFTNPAMPCLLLNSFTATIQWPFSGSTPNCRLVSAKLEWDHLI